MPSLEASILLFAILIVGAVAFLAAVWFGLFILAPRIRRALDRADAADEESRERPD
jgi:hypothetical protein